MATILDTLKKGTEYLQKYGVEDARLNMEHLIAHVQKVDRMQIYLDFDRPLSEEALESLRELTKRRSRGEPLQHLLGTVEFSHLEFATDNRALIPRPETEELAEKLLSKEWPDGVRILDMGCGSGVIGLSLAHHLANKSPKVVLVDVSPDALALARENAAAIGLSDERLTFLESDLFSQVSGTFDLIAANLPYIPNAEKTDLSQEVLRDPALALYGGEAGTEIMDQLLETCAEYLNDGGLVALEFGMGQEEHLQKKAEDQGFEPVLTEADMSGVIRFLFATKTP